MSRAGWEIVVFTAATQDYADWMLDLVDTERRIQHRLYRQHACAEQALAMLQQVRQESSSLQARLTAVEQSALLAKQRLGKREAEAQGAHKSHHELTIELARSLGRVEELNMRELQRLEARCERRVQQLGSLHDKVTTLFAERGGGRG